MLYKPQGTEIKLKTFKRRKVVVSGLQVYPTVCVYMIPQPLLENLEMLLKVFSNPVTLHYDTVFNVGDFYLSTLVFQNSMFKKDPITCTLKEIPGRSYAFYDNH